MVRLTWTRSQPSTNSLTISTSEKHNFQWERTSCCIREWFCTQTIRLYFRYDRKYKPKYCTYSYRVRHKSLSIYLERYVQISQFVCWHKFSISQWCAKWPKMVLEKVRSTMSLIGLSSIWSLYLKKPQFFNQWFSAECIVKLVGLRWMEHEAVGIPKNAT